MSMPWKKIGIWTAVVVVALAAVLVALRFFSGSAILPGGTPSFGTAGQNNPASGTGGTSASGGNGSLNVGGPSSASSTQKIFLIAQGPVVAATLVGGAAPGATNARYITGDDGHILEVPLNAPGSQPRIISQTTIPAIERALWTNQGSGVLMQYLEGSVIKTVHLTLPVATSSASTTPQPIIQFLPDGITDLAVSPDGTKVAYLTPGSSGLDGYIARSDGSQAKKMFSLALSRVALVWPSAGELLAYSKSSSGTPGIVFSINASTGAVSPVLYGLGITATADSSFQHILYQVADGTALTTYIETSATGASQQTLFGSVLPEQCIASTTGGTTLYCAAPQTPPGGNFLDLWHQGIASAPNVLLSINLSANTASILTIPGSKDGGENTDVMDLAISSHGQYLSFINKDSGKLWGIHLAP